MDTQNQSRIFTDYSLEQSQTHAVSKKFMANVFLWMFGALAVSTLFAYLFATSPQLRSYLVTDNGISGLGKLVMWSPLIFVFIMSLGYQRLSAPMMAFLFMVYAAINGIAFSFILLAFTEGSVLACFASAAAMFGIMAFMGYTTNQDLTSFGRILIMGLIGIVVASVINMFLHSSQMDWIISIVGVAVFTGLTAYDVQKLKRIGEGLELQEEGGAATATARKASVYGALTLYLDFINLFLMLLRLFGRRR